MKKLLLIVLIICSLFFVIAGCGVQNIATVAADDEKIVDCVCHIVVECYYPGYQPGVDSPFASKIVYSCAEAEVYMEYIATKTSTPVFFFMYPAKP